MLTKMFENQGQLTSVTTESAVYSVTVFTCNISKKTGTITICDHTNFLIHSPSGVSVRKVCFQALPVTFLRTVFVIGLNANNGIT